VLEEHGLQLKTRNHLKSLIALFHDVIPAIRETARNIIVRHFPIHLVKSCQGQLKEICRTLLDSPKAQDTEGGSLIACFLFDLFLVAERGASDDDVMENAGVARHVNWKVCCSFLQYFIVTNIDLHTEELMSNLVQSSYKYPLFGWLSALSKCLDWIVSTNSVGDIDETTYDNMCSFVKSVGDLVVQVNGHLLRKVFSCVDVDDQGNTVFVTSADFEEMSSRISTIVRAARQSNRTLTESPKTEIVTSDDVMLTQDHELVLACSWLSLKNGCCLLESLAMLILSVQPPNSTGAKCADLLNFISSGLITVLSSCRHRGVIESCCECLQAICNALFSSRAEQVKNIPQNHLASLLDLFRETEVCLKKAVQGGTVTRRSAGLPLITEAILSSSVLAGSFQAAQLIEQTVQVMMTCVEQSLGKKDFLLEDNFDLPAVHALYILKHLFKNATLGSLMIPYAQKLFPLAVSCLHSEMWLIRNAAMHLLGALSSRMLGQQHIEEKGSSGLMNSLDASEFRARYPALFNEMLEILSSSSADLAQQAVGRNQKMNDSSVIKKNFSPETYPVLALISKLSSERSNNTCSSLSTSLQRLIGSLSYSVRQLAVKSILALHSYVEVGCMVRAYLESLPCDKKVEGM